MLRFKFKTNILSGFHQIDKLSYELYYYNKSKILIVGNTSSDYSGYMGKISSMLKNENFNVRKLVLNDNAFCTEDSIKLIVSKYLVNNCDAIIALGNEKIISACKGAKILIDNNINSIDELIEYPPNLDKVFLTVIPTSTDCNKALDCSTFVWDSVNRKAKQIIADQLMPSLMVIDEDFCEDMPINDIIENLVLAFGMASCSIIDESLSGMLKAISITAFDLINQALNCVDKPRSINLYKVILAVTYSGLSFSKVKNNILDDIAQVIALKYAAPYRKVFICLFHSYLIKAIATDSDSANELLVNLISVEEFVKVSEDKCVPTITQIIKEKLNTLRDKNNINFSLINLGVKIKDIDDIIEAVLNSNGDRDNIEKGFIIKSIITDSL